MRKFYQLAAGLTAIALAGMFPVTTFADTPLGMYQTADKLEDYSASLCGDGEKYLCIKLLALRGAARSDAGNKLIGTNVLNLAKPAGPNKWKGVITIDGKTADSSVTVRKGVALDVHACAYVVLCASISLPAAK